MTIECFCDLGDGSTTAAAISVLQELAARHPTRVRIVFRLVGRGGPSNQTVEAALEAHQHGRFLDFLEAVYAEHGRTPRDSELPEKSTCHHC